MSDEDIRHLAKQRDWVRDHFEPGARNQYDTIEGKLRLVQTILDEGWIETTETWKLQSLGITFGDALAQDAGLVWVTVEDEFGRDPALQLPSTTVLVFPLTAISKRIERDEKVDVRELLEGFKQTIAEAAQKQNKPIFP